MTTLIDKSQELWILTTMVDVLMPAEPANAGGKEAHMNRFLDHEGRSVFYRAGLAGLLVLAINAIGHYVFEAPEIPFAYGFAAILAAIVLAIGFFGHSNDDPHHGV
jgi:hypothetical protein